MTLLEAYRLMVASLSEDERQEMYEAFEMFGDLIEVRSLVTDDLKAHNEELSRPLSKRVKR